MRSARGVVVTGGGSGIGRCLSSHFARNGWAVCVADLLPERAEKTVRELPTKGAGSFAARLDVRDPREVADVAGLCLERFGGIHAWVNNAGVTDKEHRFIQDVPHELWSRIHGVNVYGTFVCMKECIPRMIGQGHGNIVNISSLLAQRGCARAGDAAYGVSKSAVEALTEYAAAECGGTGVNVNAAYPGAKVDTGFFDNLEQSEREKLERPTILNELVYLLCCLKPDELTGGSFCALGWKSDPALQKVRAAHRIREPQ